MLNKVNSPKANRSAAAGSHKLPTPGVGEILREEFLDPLGITAYRLSKKINVSTTTILDILNGKRKITVDTSLRLSRFFGNSEHFWLNLQNDIDLRNQREKLRPVLKKITPLKRIA
ncbi:MAG: HigA family addiction module antitoxin [Ignavibacteriaceae bacterium]